MIRCALSLIAVLLLGACAAPEPAGVTQLPRTVRPVHYDLALVPDAEARTFTGQVGIDIDVLQPTRDIALNASQLRITSVSLTGPHGIDTGAGSPATLLDTARQTATFRFPRDVPAGRYRLNIEYDGVIAEQTNGLFALDYTAPAGKQRALFTQLEPADARRVFPCWDEPAHKATFALSISAPSSEMVVSNMPVADREVLDGQRTRTRFATTPPISTYLLFLAIGDFERATVKAGVTEVGVVTRRGALDQARFVLDSSAKLVEHYNSYFGIPYPLPKLDNVAAPGSSQQFAAMENWGAILTFDYAMLLDPAIATQGDVQGAFVNVAHEIAHQWFGNLVTMRWWDDLWLNESFANWMERRAMEQLHPEWQAELGAIAVRERAIDRDSLQTTHAIVQPLTTVEEINQAFDIITYLKGEMVVRMLEGYVGADAWRDGVRAYLRERQFGNATSADLWRAIGNASQLPVTEMARDFIEQPGVPLIRVEQATCKDGRTDLQLSQGEFTRDRPDKQPLRWRVPVNATILGNAQARGLVTAGPSNLPVPGCGTAIVNSGQTGYFRTLYAPPLFADLAARYAELPTIDQLGLLADSWALGLAGLQPVEDSLTLTRRAPRDAAPQLWRRIAQTFRTLDEYYGVDSAERRAFRRYAIDRLQPALVATGWVPRQDESDAVALLREDLIDTLSGFDDAAVVAEARRRRSAAAHDAAAMPAPMRKAIVGVVAHHADAATWNALLAEARAEKSSLLREQAYAWLAVAADPALAQRTLDLAVTPEPGVTLSADLIATVARFHPRLAFDFARQHREAVLTLVDSYGRAGYIARLASRSVDAEMAELIRRDAEQHLAADARKDAYETAAVVEDRARIRSERLGAVNAWVSATSDPRVSDMVQAGQLRVALFLPQFTRDPGSEEIRGDVHLVDTARALAANIGVNLVLAGFPEPRSAVEALNAGAADVTFLGIDPSRADTVEFSPPLFEVDYSLLVPANSVIRTFSDSDRAGIRIAAVRGHASTLTLSRLLKRATLVYAETPDQTFELLRSGRADAMASVAYALDAYAAQLKDSRVLQDRYGFNRLALAVAKGKRDRLGFLRERLEDARRTGVLQRAVERGGLRGVHVAAPGGGG